MVHLRPVSALALCASLLVACTPAGSGSLGDEPSSTRPSATSTSTPGPAASPSSSSVPSPTLPPDLPAAPRSDLEEFSSPSGNLGCHVGELEEGDYLGCQLLEHDFPAPARPEGCQLDLIDAVWVDEDDVVRYGMCRGDPFAVPRATLPYGSAVVRGTSACLSEAAGVTCWNTTTQHGFRVSRTSYTVF